MLIGYAMAGKLYADAKRRANLVFQCVIVNAALCLLLSLNHTFWLAGALLFLLGTLTGIVTLITMNVLIAHTDADKRGRIFSVLIMITQGITPLAMSLIGVVGDGLLGNVQALYMSCGACLMILGIALYSNRDLREFLQAGG